ncbi:MAG: EscU/YscU/HrcU family type III secretion system export apparatus switch protein, partial [Mariprofundaceae bacterium]
MSEEQDKSQQTEEATSKRIEDARKKGQVPTSKEASTALSFLFLASLAVTGLGAWMATIFMDMTRSFLSGSVQLVADPAGMQILLTDVMTDVALVVLP